MVGRTVDTGPRLGTVDTGPRLGTMDTGPRILNLAATVPGKSCEGGRENLIASYLGREPVYSRSRD